MMKLDESCKKTMVSDSVRIYCVFLYYHWSFPVPGLNSAWSMYLQNPNCI